MSEAKGYVWGPINAEDLAPVPASKWIVTSGMTGVSAAQGRLYAVDAGDHSCNEIFPYLASYALDADRFGSHAPLEPLRFEPHGIDIALRPDGIGELFVVNHGWRESVEVFEVVVEGTARPTLRWIGAAMLPGSAVGNDVAAVDGGGFVVSVNVIRGDGMEQGMARAEAGDETGGVLEWSPGAGWSELPGTGINSANGVAVSKDGHWVYIGGWHSRCIKKARRGGSLPESSVVGTDILTDNLTWTSDGRLLAAGACDTTAEEFITGHFGPEPRLSFPSRVLLVDPDTLAMETVVAYGPETFGAATTGLQVGDEIWVGAARDQGLARFPYLPAAGTVPRGDASA
ncbi:MAG: hypothetical protein ACLQRH_11665 [Acidimicrobiales bacterium]